jgi:membrane protein DedA with SNARE-associated domain
VTLPFDSWAVRAAALFLGPFVHEDVAAAMAAAFIHEYDMPVAGAFATLYAGVFVSDILIFVLGRLARRAVSLRRFLSPDKLEKAERRLRDHRVTAIALCRLVPGLLFSTFFACGFLGVPFIEFIIPAVITSLTWTAVLLFVVLRFGDAFYNAHAGHERAFLALGIVAVLVLGYVLRRVFKNVVAREEAGAGAAPGHPTIIEGMPPVPASARRISESEQIPPPLYYTPLGLRWLWLSLRHGSVTLPALADPCIEAGGLWGESKSDCLGQISAGQERWVATFITARRAAGDPEAEACVADAITRLGEVGLAFPIVAKPDVGWQGFGVQLLHDREELRRYLAKYPPETRLILQEAVPFEGEAGVLYVRMPGEATGRVMSLTLRYWPHVIGDGVSTVRELIEREPRMAYKARFYRGDNPQHRGLSAELLERVPADREMVRLSFIGSIRTGGLYRDARASITPAMSERFDAIARSMPEFWFGRFDIRFRSLDELQHGEAFKVIEVNGAGAEAIHMWDPEMPLVEAYRELLHYQSLLFTIGAANRKRGFKPMGLRALIAFTNKQNRLIDSYPPSE